MTISTATKEIKVVLRTPHEEQVRFINSTAKRKIVRAGRRSGKTVGVAIADIEAFLTGKRVLYAAPTGEQTDRYWFEVKRALYPLMQTGVYKQNDTEKYIEKIGTENRIKAKTAWNANTLRGDYADKLTFDEWQITAEDAWDEVGAPMLLDNDGDATFIYTPPSLRSSGISRARDPLHASKMFKKFEADTSGRYETFHFTSHDNPHLSKEALAEITKDMSREAYLKEILAQDEDTETSFLVYGCFNEAVCKIPRFEIPKHWLVYSGHDFGSANPAALFAAMDPGTGFIYLFHEYAPKLGKSTYENIKEFKKIIVLPGYDKSDEQSLTYNIIQRVGGNRNSEGEIRQGYTSQGWPIAAPYIERVMAQVDKAKGFMERNKIFIFEDMGKTLDQIYSCLWKLDELGKPTNIIKDEKKYHLLACLRYLCSVFTLDIQASNKPIVKREAR